MSRSPSATPPAPERTDPSPSDSGLSDVTVVSAAREIIAEVGIDGLTMRELSARLGVSLGATYHHVPSKQVLLQRVAQDLFSRVKIPASAMSDWREQVKTLVLATAFAVGQYSGMAAYVLAHIDEIGPVQLNQELIAVLERAGFTERNVRALMSALYFYGAGIAANILPVRGTETFERADVQAMFEDGLDMLLSGAALRLDAPGAEPAPVDSAT